MKLMKPIASAEIPTGTEWVYEVKYDGFRCVLHWERDSVRLISRNDTDLTANFPELIEECQLHQALVEEVLPLKLDGELVVLNNRYQANFSLLQKRGRLKNKDAIMEAAASRPVSFMAFDLLEHGGASLVKKTFKERKQKLGDIFKEDTIGDCIRFVPFQEDSDALWQDIFEYKAEGMVAKRVDSLYEDAKKHRDWYKIKNWRTINGFLTFYDPKNDYFTVCIYDNEEVRSIGKCKHGLGEEEFSTLKDLFISKGTKEGNGYSLPPAICAEINTLDLYKSELREPEFSRLVPNKSAAECTVEKLKIDLAMLPEPVDVSNTEKTFWPDPGLTKGDMLVYMREIAPYMIPFLHNRRLTVIRCPDGVHGESFFQKHLPDYAPEFINSIEIDDEVFFTLNKLDALLWFANHGAIEYHIPFQTYTSEKPSEIVFDLDPPGREAFHLAVKAANLLKQILDNLELISFVKISGGKGLQVHIPIPAGSMTYEETGVFTQAIAWTLEQEYPDLFTTERLKNKRGDRLYIDYLQHGKDKTLVAPYSPRKRDDATVAAPLFWEEVNDDLAPSLFTIENTVERIHVNGCPFAAYFETGEKQHMDKILAMIQG
nr:DNA ligase D [Virgibacillus doumboii]